ncbi:glycosyltransferase [Solidesulfovibrio sp.]
MIMPFPGAVRGKHPTPGGTPPVVGPQSFGPLAWPAWRDFSQLAQAYARDLFGYPIDVRLSEMQCLQDLLCYAFIRQNLPPGARLLDVGGGRSRVLAALAPEYECWCIDAFEGAGGGATTLPAGYGYKIIVGSMGQGNAALPDAYFDFVFSISVLEPGLAQPESALRAIFDDIRRVSRPSAYTLHCIDSVRRDGTSFAEGLRKLYGAAADVLDPITDFEPVEDMYSTRLYTMPEKAYIQHRFPVTRQKMRDFGDIFTFNALFCAPGSPEAAAGDARQPSRFAKTIPHIRLMTPCRNAAGRIDQTIASVVGQKGAFHLHYHIQDGGSTDATLAIVAKWAGDIASGACPIRCAGVDFTWESAPDSGRYDAVAKALAREAADAEFVGWINPGGTLLPGALAAVAELTAACPDVEWLLGQRLHIREDGQADQYDPGTRYPREVVAAGVCDGLLWQFVQQEGSFWRAALWRRAGGFDARLPGAAEWNLWRRFAETAVPYQMLAPLGAFRREKGRESAATEACRREIDQILPEQERRRRLEAIRQAKRLTIRCIEPSPTGELRNLTRQGPTAPPGGKDFFAAMYGDREALRAVCRKRSRELAGRVQSSAPRFSVVTPSFQQARYIEDTIMAVLLQGEDDFEHIVMDGGSTDGTAALLAEYPHLDWTSEKDRGQTHALNKALKRARGDIVAWINSDDFHTPGAFARITEAFANQADAMLILGGNLWLYEDSGRTVHFPGKALSFDDLLRYWSRGIPPAQPSLFFKKALVEAIGLPQEDLTYAMDYEYWLRAARRYPIRQIPYLLATNRLHGSSKSGSGDDWYPFFGEYHACYERYRQYSPRWKEGLILSVAVPFPLAGATRPARQLARLMALLDSLGRFKLRAMEVLVVTPAPGLVAGLDVSGIPVPVRIVQAQGDDAAAFVAASLQAAAGRCIQFVPPDMRYAQRWHGPMVDFLLDNPGELLVVDQELAPMPHAWLPAGSGIVSNAVYNAAQLRAKWPPAGNAPAD